MNRISFLLLFVLALGLNACGGGDAQEADVTEASNEDVTVNGEPVPVDFQDSEINWIARKVTGQHNGSVDLKEGFFLVDENGTPVGGNFTIDMTSIEVLDLEGDKKDKLMGHLRSEDFFMVDSFPTAVFDITEIKELNPDSVEVEEGQPVPTHHIMGDLTMKGITKNIGFNAVVMPATETDPLQTRANFKLDRTMWDIKYKSGESFGDKMIYDDFEIDLMLVAQQPEAEGEAAAAGEEAEAGEEAAEKEAM